MSENAQSGSVPGDAGEMIKRKLQEKIAQLDYEMNVELPKEIGKAREHGDLKENAEYKYAKEQGIRCN